MALDLVGACNGEGPTHVFAALVWSHSDLRPGFAPPFENPAGQAQTAPCRVKSNCGRGNHFSLIKAALAALGDVQWHWNGRNRFLPENRVKGVDGVSQHASQNVRGRTHAAILQKVNEIPQALFIAAIGHRFCERLLHRVAKPAHRGTCYLVKQVRRKHPLAADGTDLAAGRTDRVEAVAADWKTGNVGKELAANAAVGRKQYSEEALGSVSSPGAGLMRNNRSPCLWNGGLASPDSVLTTAEDGLPYAHTGSKAVRANIHALRTALTKQYSGVPVSRQRYGCEPPAWGPWERQSCR